MNTSKIVSIVIATIAVALSVSSISFTGHVFAQKDDNSNSGGGTVAVVAIVAVVRVEAVAAAQNGGSSKSDYDKFQSCLSGASNDGSATKQQIRDCFDSTYGGEEGEAERQQQQRSGSSDTNNNSGGSSGPGNSP